MSQNRKLRHLKVKRNFSLEKNDTGQSAKSLYVSDSSSSPGVYVSGKKGFSITLYLGTDIIDSGLLKMSIRRNGCRGYSFRIEDFYLVLYQYKQGRNYSNNRFLVCIYG